MHRILRAPPLPLLIMVLGLLGCLAAIRAVAANPATLTTTINQSPTSVPMASDTMPSDIARLANNDAAPITPFEIAVPDAAIADLQRRLRNTRLPDQIDNSSWEYGTDIAYLTELIEYWQDDFDWREQETQLNQFDQFKTEIEPKENQAELTQN